MYAFGSSYCNSIILSDMYSCSSLQRNNNCHQWWHRSDSVVGSRSTLTCSSSDAAIRHAFSWTGPKSQMIAYTGDPGSPCYLYSGVDRNQYNVSAPSDGSYCNLIILNATTDQAGSYTCTDGAYGTAAVNLNCFEWVKVVTDASLRHEFRVSTVRRKVWCIIHAKWRNGGILIDLLPRWNSVRHRLSSPY